MNDIKNSGNETQPTVHVEQIVIKQIPAFELELNKHIMIGCKKHRVTKVVKDLKNMKIEFEAVPLKVPEGQGIPLYKHQLEFTDTIRIVD